MSVNVQSLHGLEFEKQKPIFYAGDELHHIKQQKVQHALDRSGLDALLLFKAEAVRYITDFYVKGFRPFMEPEYVVLVAKGKPPAVGYISGSDDVKIRFRSDIEDARKLPPLSGWATTIGEMLSDYGLAHGRIGTDLMPYMVHEGLKWQFPHLSVLDAGKICSHVTAVKHPREIELIREAVRVADIGTAAAIHAIRTRHPRIYGSADAVYAMRKNGSEFELFIPLVAYGYNTSMFERVATEKTIQAGEMVILDIGAWSKAIPAISRRQSYAATPPPSRKQSTGPHTWPCKRQKGSSSRASHATRSTSVRASHQGRRVGQVSLQRQYRPPARPRPYGDPGGRMA